MDILLVNTYYYPEIQGGAEYSVKKLAQALVQKGHDVLVMTSAQETKFETVDGVDVCRIKFHSIYHSYGSVKKNILEKVLRRILDFVNPFNEKLINEVVEAFKPDIIHTNNLYEITPEIWKVARKHNIPIVHTIRDYYLMCPKCTLMKSNNTICEKSNPLCKLYQFINRKLCENVDALTAPSKMMLTEIRDRNFFENSLKQTVYNASEFQWEQIEKKIEKRNGEIRSGISFVYLGSLFKHKGMGILLEAFHELGDVNANLFIAGKGPEKETVEQACKNDSRISYVGFLEQNEIELLLEGCDVLVCPSLWNEPFGRVILDAYKNGLPVIGSNVGALPEIIDDEVTGLLVEPNNVKELTNAMNRFVTDNLLIVKFRNNLINKLYNFTIDKQINDFEWIYKKII